LPHRRSPAVPVADQRQGGSHGLDAVPQLNREASHILEVADRRAPNGFNDGWSPGRFPNQAVVTSSKRWSKCVASSRNWDCSPSRISNIDLPLTFASRRASIKTARTDVSI